ncbi:hypothetical protein [Paenibacillus sp. 1P07SE]|uniref:hypothetical protein n=1 Tax=Paenibacillus sp. 1P07SE TaxID=3132209 RepID=UPI0039A4AFB1
MSMAYEVTIDLYRDWVDTAREVFRGSGHPLEPHLTDDEIAYQYYRLQTETEEEAETMSRQNRERIEGLQQTIMEHLESAIIPDIRARTGYQGDQFIFRWVYASGEHIIEEHSEYRIPLQA